MDSKARKLRIHASVNKNKNKNKKNNKNTRKTPRAPPPSPMTLSPRSLSSMSLSPRSLSSMSLSPMSPRAKTPKTPKTPRTIKAHQLAAQYPNTRTMIEQGHSFNSNSNFAEMSQEEFWDLLEKELGTPV